MRIVFLVTFAVLLSCGQILFKQAAVSANGTGLLSALFNPWLAIGLVVYGLATVLWVWLLTDTPLSIAYPFAALGFVLVPIASVYLFGEQLSLNYMIGCGLIVTGIVATQM